MTNTIPQYLNGHRVRAAIPFPTYAIDALAVVVQRPDNNDFATAIYRPGMGNEWIHGHYGFTSLMEAVVDAADRAGLHHYNRKAG